VVTSIQCCFDQVSSIFFSFIVYSSNCSSARSVFRSIDNEQEEGMHYPNHMYRRDNLERYLRNLIASNMYDDKQNDDAIPFERRAKAITKGDPREFMG
jgi:hypothetical protein